MAKAYFKCTCGERIQVYGRNRKTAVWLADRHKQRGTLCHSCQAEAFARENAKAAEPNALAGLPALTGTAAQTAWAESIRSRKLESIGRALSGEPTDLERIAFFGDFDVLDPALPAVLAALRQQVSASWWIDRRDRKAAVLLEEVATAMPAQAPSTDQDEADLAAAVLTESTIRPPRETSATVAEIRVIGDRIEVVFPEKREDFRQLIRFQLGFAWSGSAWGRVIAKRAGPVADRAAEVGNRLLAAGFIIRIQDAELRRRALAADFEPERRRWILLIVDGRHRGKLSINWPREEDLFSAAKRLPGARWESPSMLVPASSYDAIEDFAEAHGFAISDAARQALDAERAAHDAALVAIPRSAPAGDSPVTGYMPEATGEIDPELLDD